MKAAVIRSFGAPLSYEDLPTPEPAADEVRVRLEASGLCHTDIHAAHGDWPVKPTLPLIPGHEGVGIVDALGADVTRLKVGDRVAVPWLGTACGTCEHCVSGWETLCRDQVNTGYGRDGGYAEYLVADARYVAVVPDGVDPAEAAPLTCAGVTTYKAVKVSGARPSDLVVVSGIGGLGHMALQYAKIAGATVVAVDITEDKLALAKELGADVTIDARTEDVADVVQAMGGADAVISCAVSTKSFEQGLGALKRGGRLVLVALPPNSRLELPVFDVVLGGISVIGSIVGTRRDLAEVFELHAAGRTRVVYEPRQLADVNAAIAAVLSGETAARLVFTF